MKKSFLLPVLATLMFVFLNVAHAQETPTQATVATVTGTAQIKLSDGSSVPATVGMKLAPGAAIATAKDAQVAILVHEGIVAVVAGSSDVEIEKLSISANGTRSAMMNVKSGHLASSLDPSRKSLNNYGVRTAKGVTMAKGTEFTVSVNGTDYTVVVLVGGVSVNWIGGTTVSIIGGTGLSVTSNGQPAVSLATGMGLPGIMDALTAAGAAVATAATAQTGTSQITDVINVIAAAAGNSSPASSIVASVTAAAVGAAVVNPALVTGSTSTAVALTISTAAVTSATNAGNPSAAALIVSSAVNAVNKTIDNTNVNQVVKALVDAANDVQGVTIKSGEVTGGVHASQNEKGTPVTPLDPTINVSPSRV